MGNGLRHASSPVRSNFPPVTHIAKVVIIVIALKIVKFLEKLKRLNICTIINREVHCVLRRKKRIQTDIKTNKT